MFQLEQPPRLGRGIDGMVMDTKVLTTRQAPRRDRRRFPAPELRQEQRLMNDRPDVPLPGPVTQLLARMSAGDDDALDRLFPLVYQQLRQSAEAVLRSERPGHTLQPTALVHEAYLKLIGGAIPARDRSHFLSIAARAMRQILVDHARRRGARKRGNGETPLPLDFPVADGAMAVDDLVALDDALDRLSARSERLRSVVELRFFAGLNEEQVAATLGVTTRTVERDWAKARAWLYRDVYGDPEPAK